MLRASGGQLHLANVPSSATLGGGTIGLANEQSLDAWLGHSPLLRLAMLIF